MNENYPPVITLPEGLSDEAAATMLEFLTDLTQCFERYYAGQLHRYYHRPDTPHQDLGPEQDPPF